MAVIQLGDLLYADYIRNWDVNGGIKGTFLLGAGNNTQQLPQMNLGEVIEIEFPSIDYSLYTSDPYRIPVWEFSNGVVIKLDLLFTQGGGTLGYSYRAGFSGWYENTNIGLFNTGVLAPTGDFGQLALVSTYTNATVAIAQGHTIKCFITTEYPGNAVAGVTHPTRVAFNAMCPCDKIYGNDHESIVNYYDNIMTGASVNHIDYGYGYSQGGDVVPVSYVVAPSCQWLDVLYTKLNTAHPFAPGTDPWDNEQDPEDDPSGPGGGGGQYIQESDPIDFPDLPTGGPLTSGMLKAFLMDAVSIEQFQNKLWNMSLFDITTQFQKLLNEPLNCVVSLHCLPFVPTTGTPQNVKLGSFDTEVSAARITANYMAIDCGTLNIKKMWGSALDYGPFTKDIEIFLPFIGFRNIQIEDGQGTTLELKYHVDVLTGSCVAFIKCGTSVLYSFTGNCLAHIPVSGSSSDLLKTVIGVGSSMGVGLVTGNPAAAAAGAIAGAVNTATAKNHVNRTGELSGCAGLLGEFKPYVILHRPKQSLAQNYNKFKGYPSNITSKLSSLKGYTEIEHVHLTNIPGATDAEMQQIESLLKNGVII